MNKVKQFFLTWVVLLLMATPAFAVDTTLVFTSGPLVLVFLGVCALIVVMQLIPALVLFGSMVTAVFKQKKIVKVITD